MDLSGDNLRISRSLSALDEDVITFVELLDEIDVNYVIVSGYVAILTGRSRGTEDVNIVLEPLSESETDAMVDRLADEGYWGVTMPLEGLYGTLSGGDRVRVAEHGEMIPNFELWFAKNAVEREALENAITAEIGTRECSISPIELQIAYKLRLAQHAGSTTGKDFEDALHLYATFEESLKDEQLETYVTDLGADEYYDRLERA